MSRGVSKEKPGSSMESDSIGGEEKKDEAIKNLEGAMDVDGSVKTDGTGAVVKDKKDAATHAPAAEGAQQPVPNELPPNVEDEVEDWKFVPREERDERRTRAAVMVWNVTQLEAITFVTSLLNGATKDKIRVLPNAADKGNGLTHRFEFVTLLGGKWSEQIDLGMKAAVQKGRVATPKQWRGIEYRVDVGKDPRKVGATPTPVHPVRPSAPASAATSKVVPPAAGTWSTGAAYYQAGNPASYGGQART